MDSEEDGYYSGNPSLTSLNDIKSIYNEAAYLSQSGPSTAILGEVGEIGEVINTVDIEKPETVNTGIDTAQIDTTHIYTPEERDDADSAYDSESLLGDDTRSLASYITDYRYEHGRRYHAFRDGAYWVRL